MTILTTINRIRRIIHLMAMAATVPVVVNNVVTTTNHNAFTFNKSTGNGFTRLIV